MPWRLQGPYIPYGKVGQCTAQLSDPLYSPLLHSCVLRAGEVQQHLGSGRHQIQQQQCGSAPGLGSHCPSKLPLTLGSLSALGQRPWASLVARQLPPSASTALWRSLVPAPASPGKGSSLPAQLWAGDHPPKNGQSFPSRVRNSPGTSTLCTGWTSKVCCSSSTTLEEGELNTITSSMTSRVCEADKE